MKIQCSECHKFYEYPENEVCPKCGAYNSPRDSQPKADVKAHAVPSQPQQTPVSKAARIPKKKPENAVSARQKPNKNTAEKKPKKSRLGLIIAIIILAYALISSIPKLLPAFENILSDFDGTGTEEAAEPVMAEPPSSDLFTTPAEPEATPDELFESIADENASEAGEDAYRLPEDKVRITLSGAEIESAGILLECRAIGDAIEPTDDFPFRYIFLDIKAAVTDRDAVTENVSYAFTPQILADGSFCTNMYIDNLTDLSAYTPINFTDLETSDEIEGQLFYCIPENVESLSIYDMLSGTEIIVGSYSDPE